MDIREERHFVITSNQDARAEAMAFAANSINKSSILCTVCNRSGHAVTYCS